MVFYLYNLTEGGLKMNAHNRIIPYSQGFKQVTVCLRQGRSSDWTLTSREEEITVVFPEWPHICEVTKHFTPLSSEQGQSLFMQFCQRIHICMLVAEQQERDGVERQITFWLGSIYAFIFVLWVEQYPVHICLCLYDIFFTPSMACLLFPQCSLFSQAFIVIIPKNMWKQRDGTTLQLPLLLLSWDALCRIVIVLYIYTNRGGPGCGLFRLYESHRHRGYLTFCPGCCNSLSGGYTVQIRFLLLWWQAFSRHCNCRVKTAHFLTGKL